MICRYNSLLFSGSFRERKLMVNCISNGIEVITIATVQLREALGRVVAEFVEQFLSHFKVEFPILAGVVGTRQMNWSFILQPRRWC